MPKYKNANAYDVAIKEHRLPMNGSYETESILEEYGSLPTGVTRTSDIPFSNNVIASGSHLEASPTQWSIAIPANSGYIGVDIFCQAGSVDVYINSLSNTPAKSLQAGFEYIDNFAAGALQTLIIDYKVANSKVRYDVFKK